MKKMLIAALVGGLILFVWQSLSWTMLNLHKSQTAYTSAQNEILDCIKSSNLPEGDYFLPGMPPGTSQEDYQAGMQDMIGKPWVQIFYHKEMKMNMGMNMFRGFVINFLSILLLCYVLLGDNGMTFKKVMAATLAIGAIGYMTNPYLNSIWFETNTLPDLLDAVVQWSLAGLFLAWYLPKK